MPGFLDDSLTSREMAHRPLSSSLAALLLFCSSSSVSTASTIIHEKRSHVFWRKLRAIVVRALTLSGPNLMVSLAEGARKLFLVLISSAEAERVFSTVVLMKNDIRNRVSDEFLVTVFRIKLSLRLKNINCTNSVIPRERNCESGLNN